jgi:DNA-binding NarL/FixJ family response regulator
VRCRRLLRVALAEERALVRSSLAALLREQRRLYLVAAVNTAAELLSLLEKGGYDVAVLSVCAAGDALADLRTLAARVPLVVISTEEHPERACAAIRDGARAVVFQRSGVEDLIAALQAAAEGQLWLPREVQAYVTAAPGSAAAAPLTAREREIVRYVALGLRNAEVARALFISEVTVKTHINNIFRKLLVRDRVKLALYGLQSGMIALEDYGARHAAATTESRSALPHRLHPWVESKIHPFENCHAAPTCE